MAKDYQAPKTVNRVMMWLSRLGAGPTQTLQTTGRKSGKGREVPVTPIHVEGEEYIVAPYGAVSWVLNARANPAATLRRGSHVRQIELIDVSEEAPEVVKAYWDKMPYPRRYMDVPGEATVEDFASVAGRFPVFLVEDRE